ncbi:Actin/actin-like protein, partial [Myriangium duriaei CBS 260.36]
LPSRTLVVDPGAYTIKAGLVSTDSDAPTPECSVIPNCIARARTKHTYVGSALSECTDFGEMQFKRPVERGYIVNWDLERAIFEHEFFEPKAKLYCDPSETALLLSDPPNAPTALQSNADQIIFEEFSFTAATRLNNASLSAFTPLPLSLSTSPPPTEILLLIDAGHSSTTITPVLRGSPIHPAIRRLTFGGKHLTNALAESISLRHFSLIDEPHIVSQIKHDTSFVSASFSSDLDRAWPGPRSARRPVDPDVAVEYVLPDYTSLHRGYMRSRQPRSTTTTTAAGTRGEGEEESFPLANERFCPPELLFSPLDVGLHESGLPATVMQSLAAVPRALWGGLLANIVLVGGTSLLPGFEERVEREVRALAPAELVVRVARAESPIEASWRGGAGVAGRREWRDRVLVTRQQYEEYGEGWVRREF